MNNNFFIFKAIRGSISLEQCLFAAAAIGVAAIALPIFYQSLAGYLRGFAE